MAGRTRVIGKDSRLGSSPSKARANTSASDEVVSESLEKCFAKAIELFRVEDVLGRPALRYATADRMRAPCVECHNQHPQSPKTDWKVGDVRGVLEIIRPLIKKAGVPETPTVCPSSSPFRTVSVN